MSVLIQSQSGKYESSAFILIAFGFEILLCFFPIECIIVDTNCKQSIQYRRISREASPAEATADEKGTQVYILNTRSRSSPENNESVQAVGQYRVGHVFDN